jgi:hypothetical protein
MSAVLELQGISAPVVLWRLIPLDVESVPYDPFPVDRYFDVDQVELEALVADEEGDVAVLVGGAQRSSPGESC